MHAARTNDGYTALLSACKSGHLAIVRFLVELGGASVWTTDSSGATLLIVASEYGRLELVRYLFEQGSVVNAVRGACGKTALMFASMNGHAAVVRLLLENGALRHLVCHAGRTARNLTTNPLILAELGPLILAELGGWEDSEEEGSLGEEFSDDSDDGRG